MTAPAILIVDDLVDTGATARVVRGLLPRAHFAAVYAKPAGRDTVDTFITEVSQDTWILFPWDTEPQFVGTAGQARRLITRRPQPLGWGWLCRRGSSAGSR